MAWETRCQCQITQKKKPLKKQGVIQQRLMQVEAVSGMLFWSSGSGVIRKGVLLMRSVIILRMNAPWNKNKIKILDRAVFACKNRGFEVGDHFAKVSKMIKVSEIFSVKGN
jgi:hypothetical protein